MNYYYFFIHFLYLHVICFFGFVQKMVQYNMLSCLISLPQFDFTGNHLALLCQVCLEKMQDLQLALVISRLYESEFETASTFKKILQRHVLGQDKQVRLLIL